MSEIDKYYIMSCVQLRKCQSVHPFNYSAGISLLSSRSITDLFFITVHWESRVQYTVYRYEESPRLGSRYSTRIIESRQGFVISLSPMYTMIDFYYRYFKSIFW